MSPARRKLGRLARLAALREAGLRAAEARLASVHAAALSAEARVERMRGLVHSSGTRSGPSPVTELKGAAGLRGLLLAALETAVSHAATQAGARTEAVSARAGAKAAQQQSADDFARMARTVEADAQQLELDDRAPPRRKEP